MALKRRDFLKTASVVTSGLALTTIGNSLTGCKSIATGSGGKLKNFGLQLYTLRDDLPKDPKGILKQVAAFGYKQIESFEGPQGMFWGMSHTEFKRYMDDLGMAIVSSHCNINENFERKAGEAAAIGMKYLIEPYFGPRKTIDAFKKAADLFNQKGEVCKKAGIRFAYHNHDYTFKPVEGQLPQDVLMQHTDPSLVDFEMDMYWVVAAGQDPVAWLDKYPNRFKLCHVKDKKGNETCTLGKGEIDYPKILHEAKKKNMQYYIVEQEQYTGTTPLEAAKEDATYLKNIRI